MLGTIFDAMLSKVYEQACVQISDTIIYTLSR